LTGSESGPIRASTSQPAGIEFERIERDRLLLWVARDFPIEDLDVGWTIFTGFDVTWAGTLSDVSPPSG
jgi:hypothetical protein